MAMFALLLVSPKMVAQVTTQATCSVVQGSTAYNVRRSTAYNVCVSASPPFFLQDYLPFSIPAGGVHEKVVGSLSNLKEVTQLRKVVMIQCEALSPSLLAAICRDICNSNSMEKVKVTSRVSLSVKVCLFASQHHTNYTCLIVSSSHLGEPP